MEVDDVAESISTMKLTEPRTSIFYEKWWHVEALMNFHIQGAKELLKTPEHEKNRAHYYFEGAQARSIRERLSNLENNEKKNLYGDYAKSKEYKDMKRRSKYWLEKLLSDQRSLERKLGLPSVL